MIYLSRIRVYQLAKIGISNKELIKKLNELSIDVNSHMSTLENESANVVIELLAEEAEEINTSIIGKDRNRAVKEIKRYRKQKQQKTKNH